MKKSTLIFTVALLQIMVFSSLLTGEEVNIKFLAHSTGTHLYEQGDLQGWFEKYNGDNNTDLRIELLTFPKERFYGWNNYPYDYWNIWVKHKGYKLEPSLSKLARNTDLIIWKHCFPGSMIEEDSPDPRVDDERKSLAAYKLQYNDLKKIMKENQNTKFLVWTLAVMREEDLTPDQAKRTREFVDWVKKEWDEPGDNIHIFDFYGYETTSSDGSDQSLYLRPEYASEDAHPNEYFNKKTAPELGGRIIEVLTGKE